MRHWSSVCWTNDVMPRRVLLLLLQSLWCPPAAVGAQVPVAPMLQAPLQRGRDEGRGQSGGRSPALGRGSGAGAHGAGGREGRDAEAGGEPAHGQGPVVLALPLAQLQPARGPKVKGWYIGSKVSVWGRRPLGRVDGPLMHCEPALWCFVQHLSPQRVP